MTQKELDELPLAVKPRDVRAALGVNYGGVKAFVESGQLKSIPGKSKYPKYPKWQLLNILGLK